MVANIYKLLDLVEPFGVASNTRLYSQASQSRLSELLAFQLPDAKDLHGRGIMCCQRALIYNELFRFRSVQVCLGSG